MISNESTLTRNDFLLSARALVKVYRLGKIEVRALNGLDFDLKPAEFTVIEGPSGSGKTTLLNLLGLLDQPDHGQIFFRNTELNNLAESEKANLRLNHFGFIFQTFNLIPVLTARENVEYPMLIQGIGKRDRQERAMSLLSQVGIADKAAVRPDHLSGGQRQRVAIARALANNPHIVFADEPTANLDTTTMMEILEILKRLNQEHGISFLFATHDQRIVEQAKRIISLCDGRIVGEDI